MKRVLITGGAGFIGSCLARQAVWEEGWQVLNLDRLTYAGNLDSLAALEGQAGHYFVQGDICDGELLEKAFRSHRPQAVINLAAETHVDRSIDAPAPFVQTNTVGTYQLLEATLAYWQQLPPDDRQDFRFLQVSTDEVFGTLGQRGRFSERSPYAPRSPYAASKAAADHWVRAYHETYGLPTLITHSGNNFGPYQFPEKLIPLMILNALEGRPLPIYGDGTQVRDWLYVEDHVRALRLVLAAGRPGERYMIGAEAERTNLQVVETLCALLDRVHPRGRGSYAELIAHVVDRPGHDRRYAVDPTKIKRELGWAPEVDFHRGLERTVHWYLSHPAWVERVRSGAYRRERLGLSRAKTSAGPVLERWVA